MATQTRSTDLGHFPYRLSARQVERMIETGVISDGDDIELIGGTLYKMVKQEPHNFTVGRIADLLRGLNLDGYHVREEKSVRHGKNSLPEPDVVLAPGSSSEFRPRPPETSELPLIVEVCHHSRKADYRDKLRRYAAAAVPVYWVVDLHNRSVAVFTQPETNGNYAERLNYPEREEIPVILNGTEVGRFAVADILPPAFSTA